MTTTFLRTMMYLMTIILVPSLVIAGQLPEKIVFMWQVHNNTDDQEFQLLKDLGVNTVQSFQFSTWSDQEIKTYLDRAQKYQMNVIAYLGKLLKKNDSTGQWFYNGDTVQFILKWKDHPAIGAWHICDEPKERDISAANQVTLYQFVKEIDPLHPIMISTNVVSEKHFTKYFSDEAFDILDIHKYVNPDVSTAQRKQVQNLFKNTTKRFTVIATMRAYNAPITKQKRKKMKDTSLREQYTFYVKESGLQNIGFYGWALAPNRGIKDDPSIHSQFLELMRGR